MEEKVNTDNSQKKIGNTLKNNKGRFVSKYSPEQRQHKKKYCHGNYPHKIGEAINILVEEGYLRSRRDITNMALFDFFKERNLFEAVNKIKLRKIEEELAKKDGGEESDTDAN